MENKQESTGRIDRQTATEHVVTHQHVYRIGGAALCQAAAFIAVLTAPFSFVSGAREFVIGLFMALAAGLAVWEGAILYNRAADTPEPVREPPQYRDRA